MHEHTSAVQLPDLPAEWRCQDVPVNTLTLPCRHVFHPSAIAQHFAYRHMRCPMCRTGSDEKMDLTRSELPESVKTALERTVSKMDSHDSEEEHQTLVLEYDSFIDNESVREMLSIQAEISDASAASLLVLTSRLMPATAHPATGPGATGPSATAPATAFDTFQVHRSFRRILFSTVQRLGDDPTATVRLSLRHPVLTHPITTARIHVTRFATAGHIYDYQSVWTGNEVLARAVVQDDLLVSVDLAALKRLCAHSLVATMHEFPFAAIL